MMSPSTSEAPQILDATALLAQIRTRQRTAHDVVQEACERLDAADATLSLVANRRYEQALRDASTISPEAPLAGLPVVVKDSMSPVARVPHTEAWRALRDYRPRADGRYVRVLRDAGAVVIATVTTSQLATLSTSESELFGATRNPWNPQRSTGGSSGGSAAAVAVGAVPVAHGTDIGGSLRIPASCCGVFGFKPSRGTMPACDSGPAAALWSEHVITRTVRDSALLLDIGTEHPARDPQRFVASMKFPGPPLRIGVSETHYGQIDPVGAAVLARTTSLLENLGHSVTVDQPRYDRRRLEQAFYELVAAGQLYRASALARAAGAQFNPASLEPANRSLLELAVNLGPARIRDAERAIEEECAHIDRWFDSFDVWLCSTIVGSPRPLGFLPTDGTADGKAVLRLDGDIAPLLPVMNCAGLPAMSCPVHFHDEMPAGAHFAARRGHDALLFRLAAELERSSDFWHNTVPSALVKEQS